MNKFLSVLLGAVLALGLTVDDAEAKRFGGGKSFGAKPSYNNTFKRAQSKPDATDQRAAQPGAATTRTGNGMLGGALGGLVMGGLIGALLFGGAFENINFFDILIFAAIAFLLFKLMAGGKRPSYAAGAGGGYVPAAPPPTNESVQRRQADGAFETDLLFKKGQGEPADVAKTVPESDQGEAFAPPADFDQAHFLEGAKAAYARLQKSWDEGDLGDIRLFTTDKVFGEIQDQLRERSGENRTEILELGAELLGARELGNELEAMVLFDALLREDGSAEPTSVREVWHFTRPRYAKQPTWYLDGIQQVED